MNKKDAYEEMKKQPISPFKKVERHREYRPTRFN